MRSTCFINGQNSFDKIMLPWVDCILVLLRSFLVHFLIIVLFGFDMFLDLDFRCLIFLVRDWLSLITWLFLVKENTDFFHFFYAPLFLMSDFKCFRGKGRSLHSMISNFSYHVVISITILSFIFPITMLVMSRNFLTVSLMCLILKYLPAPYFLKYGFEFVVCLIRLIWY